LKHFFAPFSSRAKSTILIIAALLLGSCDYPFSSFITTFDLPELSIHKKNQRSSYIDAYSVTKFSVTGEAEWAKDIEDGEQFTVMAADWSGGNKFVLGGRSDPSSDASDILLSGMDADSTPNWEQIITSGNNEYLNHLAFNEYAELFVGSIAAADSENSQQYLYKCGSGGTIIWKSAIDGDGGWQFSAYPMDDGGALTIQSKTEYEETIPGSSAKIFDVTMTFNLHRLDSAGAVLWHKTMELLGKSADEYWYDPSLMIMRSVDGAYVYFVCLTYSTSFFVMTDADGNSVFTQTPDSAGLFSTDFTLSGYTEGETLSGLTPVFIKDMQVRDFVPLLTGGFAAGATDSEYRFYLLTCANDGRIISKERSSDFPIEFGLYQLKEGFITDCSYLSVTHDDDNPFIILYPHSITKYSGQGVAEWKVERPEKNTLIDIDVNTDGSMLLFEEYKKKRHK